MRAVSFLLVQSLGLGMFDLSASLMSFPRIGVSPAFLFSPSVRTGAEGVVSPPAFMRGVPQCAHWGGGSISILFSNSPSHGLPLRASHAT